LLNEVQNNLYGIYNSPKKLSDQQFPPPGEMSAGQRGSYLNVKLSHECARINTNAFGL